VRLPVWPSSYRASHTLRRADAISPQASRAATWRGASRTALWRSHDGPGIIASPPGSSPRTRFDRTVCKKAGRARAQHCLFGRWPRVARYQKDRRVSATLPDRAKELPAGHAWHPDITDNSGVSMCRHEVQCLRPRLTHQSCNAPAGSQVFPRGQAARRIIIYDKLPSMTPTALILVPLSLCVINRKPLLPVVYYSSRRPTGLDRRLPSSKVGDQPTRLSKCNLVDSVH
jgi:hypothetical protein